MSEVTRCRNEAINAEAELPTEALVAFKARGWEPIGESRTRAEADAERVDAENAAADAAPQELQVTDVARTTGKTAGDAGKKES